MANSLQAKFARFFGYTAAVISVLMSGWLLVYFWGLREEWMYGRGLSSQPLPSRPLVRMAVVLIFGLALPFIGAWLMPQRRRAVMQTRIGSHSLNYAFRVILFFLGALLVAVFVVAVSMWLLDSGLG